MVLLTGRLSFLYHRNFPSRFPCAEKPLFSNYFFPNIYFSDRFAQ
jgi:hypothetical protein